MFVTRPSTTSCLSQVPSERPRPTRDLRRELDLKVSNTHAISDLLRIFLLTSNEDVFAVSTPHDMHRATRSPLVPFFSVAGIARVEERAVQRVEQLCSRLNGFINTGKPVNMTHAFGSLMNGM